MSTVRLEVNGRSHEVSDVSDDMALLWVLRDRLGLVGTRCRCGVAACGACTVSSSVSPVYACQLSVRAAASSSPPARG
jgi:isoquinoline 1-oxidoreductase alpha subunit